MPENGRQVPQSVFYRGRRAAAFQFGFQLGTGVRTYLTSSGPYILAVAMLLVVDNLALDAACGVAFGLGRFLLPLARYRSWSGSAYDSLVARRGAALFPAASVLCGVMSTGLAVGGVG